MMSVFRLFLFLLCSILLQPAFSQFSVARTFADDNAYAGLTQPDKAQLQQALRDGELLLMNTTPTKQASKSSIPVTYIATDSDSKLSGQVYLRRHPAGFDNPQMNTRSSALKATRASHRFHLHQFRP